jgi:hypothetical protein
MKFTIFAAFLLTASPAHAQDATSAAIAVGTGAAIGTLAAVLDANDDGGDDDD